MSGPLEGITVLDVSRWIAGPFCGLVLGDLGADVIKVETRNGGDDSRAVEPKISGESIYYMAFNRNKRGVTLNFRDPRGQAILRQMATKADVLIENFRPGTVASMGCSYEVLRKLNPRLVMVSISGFGQDGPLARRPCFDSIAQARSGLESMTGWQDGPPTLVGTAIADYSTALYACIGILAALRNREVTGRGQLVDLALLDTLLSMLMTAIPEYLLLGKTTPRQGNRARYVAPTGAFQTRDGWVQISSGKDGLFCRLAKAMGRADLLDDPRFATVKARLENIHEIEGIVRDWTLSHTADEIEAILEQAEVPCSKVRTIADVVADPLIWLRKQILEIDHPAAGKVPLHGVTIRLSDTPGGVRMPSPILGQHNEEVYREWFGLTSSEFVALRKEGVI